MDNFVVQKSQDNNRQNNTQIKFDLFEFFKSPMSSRQKQYEAVRAIILENQSVETIAQKFGYQKSTLYSLIRDAKAGKIDLFQTIQKGPKHKRTPDDIKNKIVDYRKQGLSTTEISSVLKEQNINISEKTVERIIKIAGFSKLKRRTNKELGISVNNKIIPDRSAHLDFSELEKFNIDCPFVGIFFFIPYIIESGILGILKECNLPKSSDIEATHACLSMLLFKLIGAKRLSHISNYDQEPGLGLFAGLNILPKSTYMSTYSCRCSDDNMMELQYKIISTFIKKYPEFYGGKYINLDFHSIPHYGDESEMEKVWCGSRGKAMKGANTVFAQDSESNAIIYTRSDILRKEESQELLKFIEYWNNIKGEVTETLVFDCKFTNYSVLDQIADKNIKFVTLRKRFQSLVDGTLKIPESAWKKVKLSIPKRKYNEVSVYETRVKLSGCNNEFRQIIVKNNGRNTPTFIVTNDFKIGLKDILEVYAKRWHIENKFGEIVMFFNLNALSSPLMVRIHFDIIWTVVADTLYHRFAMDLRRFEDKLSPQIFKKFIDIPGRVIYDGNKIIIKIRKRAHTPILKGVEKLKRPFPVPWLDNKTVEIEWTA